MAIATTEILKLFLAILLGGAIGLERELHHKAAGFRTITLICMGAALFTILSIRIEGAGRIAANIVTGIGFLGAGVILHETNRIKGLTTAAAIWLSAGLGMGVGAGDYALSIATVLFTLPMMFVFSRVERWLDGVWEVRHYQLALPNDLQKLEQIEAQFGSCGLKLGLRERMKRDGAFLCSWDARGSCQQHDCFVEFALTDPEIKEITW